MAHQQLISLLQFSKLLTLPQELLVMVANKLDASMLARFYLVYRQCNAIGSVVGLKIMMLTEHHSMYPMCTTTQPQPTTTSMVECHCYNHQFHYDEQQLDAILAPADVQDSDCYINHITELYINIPCVSPVSKSPLSVRLKLLCDTLKEIHLPMLQVLNVNILINEKDELSEDDQEKVADLLEKLKDICDAQDIFPIIDTDSLIEYEFDH